MQNSIQNAIKSGHGNAVVYAGAIGLLLSDIIPTPADAAYFYLNRKNRIDFENKKITAQKYWVREAAYYYGLNPLWWLLVLGAVYGTKGDYSKKMKVGIGLIAMGAVVGVVVKNINEDVKQQQTIQIVPNGLDNKNI